MSFNPPSVERGDVLIENGIITATGRRLEPRGDVHRVDARGRVVIPGLVSAHTHLGLDPIPGLAVPADAGRTSDERFAHRATAHTEASVICAAFSGALRAVRAGTTCVFDSHASPGFTHGSLMRLREVLLTVGLRGMVSYRVSSSGGAAGLKASIAETEASAVYGGSDHFVHGVGCGNPLDLSDESLARLAAIAKTSEVPFHGEVGTIENEEATSKKKHGKSSVARLVAAGLLDADSILRTGPWISAADLEQIRAIGATPVNVPLGDLAAGRPLADPAAWLPGGAFGTDAQTPDVLAQARTVWHRARSERPTTAPDEVLALINGGYQAASRLFGLPFGRIEAGYAADLVILDYRPAWPLNEATVSHHVVAGLDAARVLTVMIAGRFILRDGAIVTLDAPQLLRQVQRGAMDFWTALTGTTFPGWEQGADELDEVPEPRYRAGEVVDEEDSSDDDDDDGDENDSEQEGRGSDDRNRDARDSSFGEGISDEDQGGLTRTSEGEDDDDGESDDEDEDPSDRSRFDGDRGEEDSDDESDEDEDSDDDLDEDEDSDDDLDEDEDEDEDEDSDDEEDEDEDSDDDLDEDDDSDDDLDEDDEDGDDDPDAADEDNPKDPFGAGIY